MEAALARFQWQWPEQRGVEMMEKSTARVRRMAAASLLAAMYLGGVSASRAEDAADQSSKADSGWHFYWPTYLWAAGASGTSRTLPPLPATTVDISFGDSLEALKDLDGGLITTLFARKDRLLLMGDINWMKLSPSETLEIVGQPVKLSSVSESLTFMPAIGYRLVDDERILVDVYAGAKFWYMENSVKVEPAVVTPNKVDVDETWVDGVVGGQIRADITERLYVNALGFVGTGGSQYFFDVYGGVGYVISRKLDAFAGYRVMQVEHENGSFLYDITQQGPLFGIAAKF